MIATQDAVIIGRRGYDEWVGFWPGSEIEPFATFINGVAKQSGDLHAAGAAVDERARDRRRSGRVRAAPEGRSWRRHWRARQHLGRPGAARRRRCRRTPARDRSEHRGRRDDDSSTVCHRFSSSRSEARSHRLAICSSTIALFVGRCRVERQVRFEAGDSGRTRSPTFGGGEVSAEGVCLVASGGKPRRRPYRPGVSGPVAPRWIIRPGSNAPGRRRAGLGGDSNVLRSIGRWANPLVRWVAYGDLDH